MYQHARAWSFWNLQTPQSSCCTTPTIISASTKDSSLTDDSLSATIHIRYVVI
jgi:hypothetical protein